MGIGRWGERIHSNHSDGDIDIGCSYHGWWKTRSLRCTQGTGGRLARGKSGRNTWSVCVNPSFARSTRHVLISHSRLHHSDGKNKITEKLAKVNAKMSGFGNTYKSAIQWQKHWGIYKKQLNNKFDWTLNQLRSPYWQINLNWFHFVALKYSMSSHIVPVIDFYILSTCKVKEAFGSIEFVNISFQHFSAMGNVNDFVTMKDLRVRLCGPRRNCKLRGCDLPLYKFTLTNSWPWCMR